MYDNISNSDLVLFPCNLLSLTQKIDNCQVNFEMNSSRIPFGRNSGRKSRFSSISEDVFFFLYVFKLARTELLVTEIGGRWWRCLSFFRNNLAFVLL